MPVPRKAPKAQNRSEKLGSWKGPKNHNSFFAYKRSGFVRWSKTLETEEAGTPKVYKKNPLFWTRIEASRGKKGKIRYVLSGFSANPTYPEFCGQKNSDFSGRMEVAKSLFERVAPTPRNPYKTSANPLLGESGRTPGTRFPFLEGKMWPDSPPTAYIYIPSYRERGGGTGCRR